MELRRIIRTDIAASVIAHLSLLALIIVISEVHPYHTPPMETVSVDIVTPDEVKQQEAKEEVKDKAPEPAPDLKLPKLDFKEKTEATQAKEATKEAAKGATKEPAKEPTKEPASPEPQRQQPQQQASPTTRQREANAQPQSQATLQPQAAQQQPPPQQPPPQPAAPAFVPPQPDVTVKYGVMLGLPPELPPPEPKETPKDDGGDAKDSIAAKLPAEVVAEFRRHFKSCAKLPAGVSPSDAVRIRLRAVMTTDGRLAREPILIEAPPSAKGPLLVQSATKALEACQPYKMLPVDKYEEWKVMDLPFTPRDFGS